MFLQKFFKKPKFTSTSLLVAAVAQFTAKTTNLKKKLSAFCHLCFIQ